MVAKGYHQTVGLDFFKTFSLVVKLVTIRVVLTLSISQNWPIRQLDVQNKFLHGDLTEEVFMMQPLGFVLPEFPNNVCKLEKTLYGLKQSSCAWFTKLSHALS